VPEGRLSDPLSGRAEITDLMRAAGFVFVALDLDGLRSGGMNSLLQLGPTRRAG
jgi:PP-loop superfamily ATP-utilizing enzyme